ncbi:MAG: Ig-like domain-containing protein, partial [Gammaproteobacteria bacterium]
YVADGTVGGLQIVDVSSPTSPTIVGSATLPGEAQDVVVAGTRAYVAAGAAGLHIVDVSNPATPAVLGSVDTPGTARGVAVSGNLAVVADDAPSSALRFVDISNPAAPQITASVSIPGAAQDVAVSDTLAYVSAHNGGFDIVDFTSGSPQIVGSLSGAVFVPRDAEVSGRFALVADELFVNAVPIVDVQTPASPALRAVIDFAGNYNGTGIAVDPQYVYMTGSTVIQVNGSTGDTKLFIGQYLSLEDNAGIAPTVSITSPTQGDTVVAGSTITITASATDDVQVAAVDFLVDGQVVARDTTAPFAINFTVPSGVSSLTLGAIAIDVGANQGLAPNVTVNVIADTGTAVIGRVTDTGGNPVSGATVTTNSRSSVTAGDGSFSIASVPTSGGTIVVLASASVSGVELRGQSAPTPAVP